MRSAEKNMYKVECPEECRQEGGCIITLDDDTTYHLTDQNWNRVVQEGLKPVWVFKGPGRLLK